MLSNFQKENVQSFEVSRDVTKNFNHWKDEFMQHILDAGLPELVRSRLQERPSRRPVAGLHAALSWDHPSISLRRLEMGLLKGRTSVGILMEWI